MGLICEFMFHILATTEDENGLWRRSEYKLFFVCESCAMASLSISKLVSELVLA
jgi:hypothetical protein